jgi:hypothetical protein
VMIVTAIAAGLTAATLLITTGLPL